MNKINQSLDINFAAPHRPQACVRRIQRLVEETSSFPVNTRSSFTEFKSGNIHFKIDRSFYELPTHRRFRGFSGARIVGRSNYVKLRVEGYLSHWADSESTLVMGKARVLPKTYLINALYLMVFTLPILLLAFITLPFFAWLLPIILLMVLSIGHMTLVQPDELGEKYKKQLIRDIERRLQHPQRTQEMPKIQMTELIAQQA